MEKLILLFILKKKTRSKTNEIHHDWKPFNLDSSQCYDCGFHTMTTVGFDSLKDLNLERDDIEEWGDEELKPLKELREQTQWAKDNMKYYITEEQN